MSKACLAEGHAGEEWEKQEALWQKDEVGWMETHWDRRGQK